MASSDIGIKLKADEFYTATRFSMCGNAECRFNGMKDAGGRDAGLWCGLKNVELDEKGTCKSMEVEK